MSRSEILLSDLELKPEPRRAEKIDEHVGRKLRLLRLSKKLSQSRLAEELNVSFQQVQKYENGANRISASRLFRASRVLGVPIESFFEGLPGLTTAR